MSWKWSYFEKINDEAKCILCGKNVPMKLSYYNAYKHLKREHRSESEDSSKYWQDWFTTENNEMECKLCKEPFPFERHISCSMTRHIEVIHTIDKNKATKIITYINEEICGQSPEYTYYCKKCSYTFPDDKNCTLIKHMLENHLSDIPAEIIPVNLNLPNSSSSFNTNVDENTAASTSHSEETHEMETHEMETHEMDENIASKMVTYMTNEIDDANTNTCKKCSYIFPDNRFTTLIDHSLKKHQGDILANLISEGFLNDLRSSNRNVDENTAASTSH